MILAVCRNPQRRPHRSGDATALPPLSGSRYPPVVASLAAFDGHLRRVAQAARQWTPRLISIAPREDSGRTAVHVRTECSTPVYFQLIRTMEDLCRRERIPPDYLFPHSSRRRPDPVPPLRPSA